MIRCIIIEDEYYAREELKHQLKSLEDLEILSLCENAVEGLKEINKHHPDLIFLDIQLPMISGFEMLSMIEPSIMPKVIFTTAYDEYAVKAFEENAVDYLLKPIENQRLLKAIEKVEKLLENLKQEDSNSMDKLIVSELTRIPCSLCRKIKLIPINEIEFVHTDDKGTYVALKKESYYTDLTLKVIELRSKMIRCHKQYLFNPEKISEIEFEDNQTAKLITISGQKIPVSRSFIKQVKETLIS
ncbi:MAG: two-component system response regulator BtsR [Candidatus Delongbacteria bacterium]|nr:two-component system response regulator BtsR [Candidatus Delongbacteria bacterium]MBN2835627.1 two-component system response regulator BtsR [Candidatus Delongbacteria bacterium]